MSDWVDCEIVYMVFIVSEFNVVFGFLYIILDNLVL